MDYSHDPFLHDRIFKPREDRYEGVDFRRFGTSGLQVSPITLGTWQNFSNLDSRESVRDLYLTAFDQGINSFDFGNNYGRPPGSAESLFGTFLKAELAPFRDELIITTKAGYDMWAGPTGRGSSLKYLVASVDQSLKRLGLDYVDIFYSHRFDPETPIEETAEALDFIRRSGRCLYVGISSYSAEHSRQMMEALSSRGTNLIVHQSQYAILNRWPEPDVLPFCQEKGVGFAAFSPLAQGLLSEKYLAELPEGSRAAQPNSSLYVNDWDLLRKALAGLNELARQRGQTLTQMALSWVLSKPGVSTAVIGARTPQQIVENTKLLPSFTDEENARIEALSEGIDVDLWKASHQS
ncbi:MAG: aldo/keto reductase [Magnetovibrionaceae bacterium]